MATKDWKKLSERREILKNVTTWYHRKGIAKLTLEEKNYFSERRYEVSITVFKFNVDEIYAGSTYFKTESQALKFAKNYMRTH